MPALAAARSARGQDGAGVLQEVIRPVPDMWPGRAGSGPAVEEIRPRPGGPVPRKAGPVTAPNPVEVEGPRGRASEPAATTDTSRDVVRTGGPGSGIDAGTGPAAWATELGISDVVDAINDDLARRLASDGRKADAILAGDARAHVDGIDAFVAGFATLIRDDGIAAFGFPCLRDPIEGCAFDTVHHERVLHHSLAALDPPLARHGLHLDGVARLPSHGGSLRLTAGTSPGKTVRLEAPQAKEEALGMGRMACHAASGERVAERKRGLRALSLDAHAAGTRIAAYQAAAEAIPRAALPAGPPPRRAGSQPAAQAAAAGGRRSISRATSA